MIISVNITQYEQHEQYNCSLLDYCNSDKIEFIIPKAR